MTKDYLLDDAGIELKTNASIQLGSGTKRGAVLSATGGTELDAHAVQWGSMYLDTAGAIGPVNRLHYWYQGYRFKNSAGSVYDWGGLYAYSNDYGLTWTRPNLGLVSYNGNTNNNVIFTTAIDGVYQSGHFVLVGVAVVPTDAKPFKFILSDNNDLTVTTNIHVYESTDAYFQVGATLLTSGHFWDHAEAAGTFDGKPFIFIQELNGGSRFAMAEILSAPLASATWQHETVAGNGGVYGGRNCVTSATTIVSPEAQNHGGTFVKDVPDMWGRVAVISPQGCGGSIWWHGELCTLRGYEDGIFSPSDVKRVDSPSQYLIPLGTPYAWGTWPAGDTFGAGAFDGGSLGFVGNGAITLPDGSERYFYSGFQQTQQQESHAGYDWTAMDRCSLGAIDFRQDGITKLSSTGASPSVRTVTLTKDSGAVINVNYSGALKVELLDSVSNAVLTGYEQSSCDLPNGDHTAYTVTWGGGARNGSELTSFKMKFYL